MPGQERQAEVEPLVERVAGLPADDASACAGATDTPRAASSSARARTRFTRRDRMPEERIEHDLVRARLGRLTSVLDADTPRRRVVPPSRPGIEPDEWATARHGSLIRCRPRVRIRSDSAQSRRTMQFVDRLLAQSIQLADRREQSPVDNGRRSIEPSANGVSPSRPSCSRRRASSSPCEMRGRQRRGALHRDLLAVSDEHGVERLARGSAQRHVEPDSPRLGTVTRDSVARARSSSAACELRTTRHPTGTRVRARIDCRVRPCRVARVRTLSTVKPMLAAR